MEILAVPRVLISGIRSEAGRSLFSLGLAHELRRRGLSASCALSGINLPLAALLRRASGRFVRTLDHRLLSSGQILQALFGASVGANLVMIAGRTGLLDGLRMGDLSGSDFELARLTKTPALLVVDARGFGQTLGALLQGVASIEECNLAGVIFNRLHEAFHDKERFRKGFDLVGGPPILGSLPEIPDAPILGSRSAYDKPVSLSLSFLVELADLVAQNVDVDMLVQRATEVRAVRLADWQHAPFGRRTRIAVSDDSCFSIVFQDNLELLRYYGAEIVPFSPLADAELPRDIGCVYMCGAYLAEYAWELARNESMRRSLKEFVQQGGVLYSEGTGTVYLCRRFKLVGSNEFVPGLGLLPLVAHQSPNQVTICESNLIEDCVLGTGNLMVRGMVLDHWRISEEGTITKVLRRAQSGSPAVQEGYSPSAQSLCTLAYNHFGSHALLARNLVDAAEVVYKIS